MNIRKEYSIFTKKQDCIIYPLNTLLSYVVSIEKSLNHTVTTLLLSLLNQSTRVINYVDQSSSLSKICDFFLSFSDNLIVNYFYCFWGHKALESHR